MRKFENTVLTCRGNISQDFGSILMKMGADGWAVVAAYAVPESGSTMMVHHYVLRRGLLAPTVTAKGEGKRR